MAPNWMLPYSASITVAGNGDVTLIDVDGTERIYTKTSSNTPPILFDANKEDSTMVDDGTDYVLTRYDGTTYKWDKTNKLLHTIVSRTAHTISISHDSNKKITQVTDGFGRITKFFYITYGSNVVRLNEIREEAPGNVGFQSTFLQYDEEGKLISISNPLGQTTGFVYDGSDRISQALDSHGHATTYTYDGSNRVTNIEDPVANDTVIAYTSTTTTVTNRISKATEYTFDASRRLIKIKDALNNETEFTYDATTWEVATMLGPKIPVTGTPWSRHQTILTYGTSAATQHDLKKREVKKITDTDSTGTLLAKDEWTHNAQHDVLTHKNPLDKVTTYTYKLDGSSNSVGLVATVVNALSQTVLTNTYDSAGNLYRLLSGTNGVSKTTTYAYNQNTSNSYGTPDRITTPSGKITNLKVDVRGRVYETTDPTGNPIKSEFDALNREIRRINPDGTATENVYDCCHLAATVDENKRGTFYAHDTLGRLVSTIDAAGEETTYGYNAEGWQTTMVDPRGKTTTTAYDDIGRVTSVTYPGSWQEIFTYFEPGHLKSKKNKQGATETLANYEYDDLYQLKKKDFPSGTDTEFETDAHGRRTKMKDASGEKRYTYDRLLKIVQGPTGFTEGTNENYKLEYTWNAASQRTQMKLTIRTIAAKTWDYAYHDDGQLNTVTNPDSDVTTHAWLNDGRPKTITLDTGSTREFFYQDTTDAHAYVAGKNRHLRKTLDKKSGGATICSFAYELDPTGNRLSVTDKDAKYKAFGYDPNYQLTAETKWSAKVPGTRERQDALQYDANGNRVVEFVDAVKKEFVYGDNNELLSAGAVDFAYDHFGNTTMESDGSSTALTFEYDDESHLLKATDENTADKDEFAYDGDGRRFSATWASVGTEIRFVYDELSSSYPALISEYTLVSGTFTIKSLNTHGLGLISTNREGTKRYFHYDAVGSTAHLTDNTQTITDSYTYTAFGVSTSTSGSSTNPFRYVGQYGYYDDGSRGAVAHLMLLGVRYYLAAYGIFITWDAWRTKSLYQYAFGNPLIQIDPRGTFPLACALACAGAAICAFDIWAVCKDWTGFRSFMDCAEQTFRNLPPALQTACGIGLVGCLACMRRQLPKPGPRTGPPPAPPPPPPATLGGLVARCVSVATAQCFILYGTASYATCWDAAFEYCMQRG